MNIKLASLAFVAVYVCTASYAADTINVQLSGSFGPSPCTVTPSSLAIVAPNLAYDTLKAAADTTTDHVFSPALSFTIDYKCTAETSAGIRFLSPTTGVVGRIAKVWANSLIFPVRDSQGKVVGGLQLSNATTINWQPNYSPSLNNPNIYNYLDRSLSNRLEMQVVKAVIDATGITHTLTAQFHSEKLDLTHLEKLRSVLQSRSNCITNDDSSAYFAFCILLTLFREAL